MRSPRQLPLNMGSAAVGYRRRSKLRLHQLGEKPAALDQLVERAGLDDPSVLKHQNARRIAHGGEPVGDDEGGAAFHDFVERQIDALLGHRIERAGGFVEDQDRRVLEQRAGDGEPLPLAAGEQPAALADRRLQAAVVAVDEFERLRAGRGVADFGVGGVRLADAQVFRDRAVEQQRLLEHDADIAAQPDQPEIADIGAVDRDGARLRIERAIEQRQRRRLAAAGRPDQRDAVAGQRLEGQIDDGGTLAVVGKRHILEFDMAVHAAGIDRARAGRAPTARYRARRRSRTISARRGTAGWRS